MRPLFAGFADELMKIARVTNLIPYQAADPMVEIIKQKAVDEPHKDYARAALAGAIVAPIASITGKNLGRVLRNRAIRKAMATASPSQVLDLQKELATGPLIGRFRPGPPAAQPAVTYDQLAGDAIMGAIGGSAIEALKKSIEGDKK